MHGAKKIIPRRARSSRPSRRSHRDRHTVRVGAAAAVPCAPANLVRTTNRTAWVPSDNPVIEHPIGKDIMIYVRIVAVNVAANRNRCAAVWEGMVLKENNALLTFVPSMTCR